MQQIQTQNSNIFSSFPLYNMEQPGTAKQYVPAVTTSQKADEVVINTQKQDNNKNKNKKFSSVFFGSTLATSIMAAGAIGLIFVKGHPGSRYTKWINKLQKSLQNPNASKRAISYNLKKGTKKTLDVLQASSNFAAIKDSWADKLYRKVGLGKFADKTTKTFKEIVDNTLIKAYRKVGTKIDDFIARVSIMTSLDLSKLDPNEIVDIKGVKKPLQEWLDLLSIHTKKLNDEFRENFSTTGIKKRDLVRQEALKDVPDEVAKKFALNKEGLFNLQNYKTYATEEAGKAGQEALKANITTAKKKVTNNIDSIMDEIDSSVKAFQNSIKPDDQAATGDLFSTIRKELEKFRNCNGQNEAAERELLSGEIKKFISLQKGFLEKSSKYTQEEKDQLLKHLDFIQETIAKTGTDSKGELEEIMTILNGLKKSGKISEESYTSISKQANKIRKGMAKATELESGEYFLKQAELKVGSAPNDVVSLIFPAAVGAYAIAKGDDKEEKVSATLTTCIPLVGTMATFVYGTIKMLSGSTNLIFSAVTGLALNELGKYCDKLYKKYKETGSVKTVVKEEAQQIWTDVTHQQQEQINATKVGK